MADRKIQAKSPSAAPDENPDELAREAGSVPDSPDSPPQDGRWYILHTYSGFEQRVEQTIREMMRTGQDGGLIREIVVPTEKVIELGKGGQKRTTTRKFYPGYVMIRMVMTDFSWHLVQNIPKVTGFVGGKSRPAPMGTGEAERILSLMETRQEQPRPKFNFERGDEVRVVDGPFGGFNGMVEDVNYDKGKLRVAVSIFGRQTPVELDFIQVSKG
jgi:transcriptional antiterminator NusG